MLVKVLCGLNNLSMKKLAQTIICFGLVIHIYNKIAWPCTNKTGKYAVLVRKMI